MSDSIEWSHAHAGFTLIGPTEDAGDGNCPDDEMEEPGNYGLLMGQCCLYGQPEELLGLLSSMKSAIINQMIDDGRFEPADGEDEQRYPDPSCTAEVPF